MDTVDRDCILVNTDRPTRNTDKRSVDSRQLGRSRASSAKEAAKETKFTLVPWRQCVVDGSAVHHTGVVGRQSDVHSSERHSLTTVITTLHY